MEINKLGTLVDIKRSEEASGHIWLADGNRLHVRVFAKAVYKVDSTDNRPHYQVQHETIIVVKEPK